MIQARHVNLVLLFLLFLFGSSLVGSGVYLLTDYWWFQSIGYESVFLKVLQTRVLLGVSVGLGAFLFLAANFFIATASRVPWVTRFSVQRQHVQRLILPIVAIIALMIGFGASAHWESVLRYLHGVSFQSNDPIFSRDIGFYVFTLPLLQFAFGLSLTLIILSLAGAGGIYAMRGLMEKRGKFTFHFAARAQHHLGILGAFLFLLLAVGAWLAMIDLLYSPEGPVAGAVFADVHARLPLFRIQMFIAAIGAGLIGISAFVRTTRLAVGALVIYIGIALVGGIYPALVQRFIVAPNELVKEAPFIERNITATRDAYRIDHVVEQEITGDQEITSADIDENVLTVKNVRLWDRQPLLDTFSQIQEIRTYYDFASVDNDRYIINGELRQIMLSPRELDSTSLPNRTWVNEYLTFTHGYGLTLGPVNQVTPEGLPVLFIKDLPPKSDLPELTVTRPEIYYGEQRANDHVFVNTKTEEFDYPSGDTNIYTTYTGTGGVQLDSFFKKLLFTIRYGSIKTLLSRDITPSSRTMFYRNIMDRAERIFPFLIFDNDPYLIVTNGRLVWMLDAYTMTDQYPYAQPMRLRGHRLNYIRNAVKLTIDAYDGSIEAFVADPDDPIIRTYKNIFPGVFRPLESMPQDLRAHIRYPQDIFLLQSSLYTIYHMQVPQVFYNKEDLWDIPQISNDADPEFLDQLSARSRFAGRVSPRHMIMKLPGEQMEEYVLMVPFTPNKKDNLSAWMAARSDGDQYGELFVYRFPKQKLIFGPRQIIARINQDADISRQITLWDQRGSQVIQGPLLVIPIEESLLYVRPLYIRADAGKIPELKRVIVAHGNKIAMEKTLEETLARLFGMTPAEEQPKEAPAGTPAADIDEILPQQSELIRQANTLYQQALDAQRSGDWARYGELITDLGQILQDLTQN